jgi:hypothetical protein
MSITLGSYATPNNSVNIDMLDRNTTTTNTIVVNKPEDFCREREKLNN